MIDYWLKVKINKVYLGGVGVLFFLHVPGLRDECHSNKNVTYIKQVKHKQ